MTMQNILSALMVVVVCALSGCGGRSAQSIDVLTQIQQSGVVRVAIRSDNKPFGVRYGDMQTGFDADIATAIAGRIGASSVEWVPISAAERLSVLTEGRADLVLGNNRFIYSRRCRARVRQPHHLNRGCGLAQALPIPNIACEHVAQLLRRDG